MSMVGSVKIVISMRTSLFFFSDEVGKDRNQVLLACFNKMKILVNNFQEGCKQINVKLQFSLGDCLYICSSDLSLRERFDVIHTSNLMDHLGLVTLLLICRPLLKRSA